MNNFLIRFVGHINERIRPENFPKEVWVDYTLEDVSDEQVKSFVQKTMTGFIQQQGMVVDKESFKLFDPTVLQFDKKMFVPMSMMAWMDLIVKTIHAQIPQELIEGGKAALPEGNSVPIQ